MTSEELQELLADCPVLYHAARSGSWSSIYERGLLSTTAILDIYGINQDFRKSIEKSRRASQVVIQHPKFPSITIRDQLPMNDSGLKRCLPKHMEPSDWYALLNQKVFFWLTKERLGRLLGAESYRHTPHDVIEIDARRLIEAYLHKIWLCPINSGYTKYVPEPRDENTFQRIDGYPYSKWRQIRKRGERVVELAIDYSVPDIREFVTRVVEMTADGEKREIYSSSERQKTV
jgi:hypothetical protein